MSDKPLDTSVEFEFYHKRYNELTSLRSTIARHYIALTGLIGAGVSALFVWSGTGGELKEHFLLLGFLTGVVALIGVSTVLYDSMVRAISKPCGARIRGRFKGNGQEEKPNEEAQKPDEEAPGCDSGNKGAEKPCVIWRVLNEELCFRAPVMLVAAAGIASALVFFILAFWEEATERCLPVMWSTFAVLAVLVLWAMSEIVFAKYPAGDGLPDADRTGAASGDP